MIPKAIKNDLNRFPNAKRGLASRLCDEGLLAITIITYFIAHPIGYKLGKTGPIGFVAVAKIAATPIFFLWVKCTMNLEKMDPANWKTAVNLKISTSLT